MSGLGDTPRIGKRKYTFSIRTDFVWIDPPLGGLSKGSMESKINFSLVKKQPLEDKTDK